MLLVVVPLLVTHAQELQVERCGMSHFCTHLTPRRRGVAIGKLYEVQCILDIVVQLVHGHVNTGVCGVRVLELTRKTARDNGQRLAAEVLAELEELKESQSIALVVVGEVTARKRVVPAVLVQRTVLHGPHTVLPVIARLQVSTLYDTSAGETEHAGLHVEERLCQVLAHTVLTTFPRVSGEKADVLHVCGHLAVTPHAQVCFVKGALGLDGGRVFLPLLAAYLHAAIAQLLVFAHRGVVHEVYPQLGLATVRHARPYREAVFLAAFHTHAEETVVLNHGVLVAMARWSQPYVVGIFLKGAVVFQRHLARDVPSCQVVRKLERAVFHQFGIQATVSGIVNVLKEDAVHR